MYISSPFTAQGPICDRGRRGLRGGTNLQYTCISMYSFVYISIHTTIYTYIVYT